MLWRWFCYEFVLRFVFWINLHFGKTPLASDVTALKVANTHFEKATGLVKACEKAVQCDGPSLSEQFEKLLEAPKVAALLKARIEQSILVELKRLLPVSASPAPPPPAPPAPLTPPDSPLAPPSNRL